jgi:hypothetical protein
MTIFFHSRKHRIRKKKLPCEYFKVEGVRLFNAHDFFEKITSTKDSISKDLKAFENGECNPAKQVKFRPNMDS